MNNNKNLTTPADGKIIRDPIHGDIVVDDKFVDIIDTPEFQRLRRISQLGPANFLFPSAEYSRFSHAVGTYHIMKLIINRFKNFLADMNLEEELGRDKINLALAAALLHDIGHGPFSHTFEKVFKELSLEQEYKPHEEWGEEIITAEDSNLRQVLENNFGSGFPEQVANLIGENYEVRDVQIIESGFAQLNLLDIISSLVSSQLDADRMDYLLRDSFFTGVAYGKFDLSRLINSLSITVEGDNYHVCIPEKYLSTIEEYLISRYQMYEEIYSHEFKRKMELVLSKVFQRASELYKKSRLNSSNLPQALVSLLAQEPIKVEDYIELDDVDILAALKGWKKHPDDILSILSSMFIDRKKFTRLNILDNAAENVEEFKQKLLQILVNYGVGINNLKRSYFWLESPAEDDLYKELYREEKEMIRVLGNDGTLKDFIEVSKVIEKAKKNSGSKDRKLVFISFEILKEVEKLDKKGIAEIEELIELYNIRNRIEISRKYMVEKRSTFKKIKKALKSFREYQFKEGKFNKQVDYYFDAGVKELFKSNVILKIRRMGDESILIIKTPAGEKVNNDRFTYQKTIESLEGGYEAQIRRNREFIFRHLPDISKESFKQLALVMKIVRSHKKVKLKEGKVKFELTFNDLSYYNQENGRNCGEYQFEIELKSDYPHRINLNNLSNYLEGEIEDLTRISDSNYERALSFT